AAERAARRAADFDYKKWARVEKIPGASVEDSRVLRGVMFEKDVVVPSRMRRSIKNPRILLLDCPLEYKKGENQANVELAREEDFAALLAQEEAWTRETCAAIAALKPDLVVTEKGLSDLASHFLCKAGISAIRRVRKTDNNRLARACGATVVSRAEEATEADLGCGAGLF
ncbi:TCP-1/cpn60 chaperonin, partial [Helicosporidium sp. ATCC 50920]